MYPINSLRISRCEKVDVSRYEKFELRVHALGSDWNLVTQDGLFRVLSEWLATVLCRYPRRLDAQDKQIKSKT